MAKYTQKAIMNTFREMLVSMPFDRITVSALAKKAEISPNTFYYHYSDIYDLLNDWFRYESDSFLSGRPRGETWESTFKSILHVLKDNEKIVYHIYDGLSHGYLEKFVFHCAEDFFYKIIVKNTEGQSISDERKRKISNVCCYTFLGFFLKFVFEGMTADIDESVDSISSIISLAISRAMMTEIFGAEGILK